MRDVFAEEVLGKIRRGENVEYDNVNIKGFLNLAEANLPIDKNEKIVVKSEIHIENSRIEIDIDFRNAVFHNPVHISGTIICGDLFFNGTCFCKEVYLEGSQFNGQASFAGAIFMRKVFFTWTRFGKSTKFSNATFGHEAQFDDAEFNSDVHFEAARFIEFAFFKRAKFNADANFRGTKFQRNAEFKDARFNGDTCFIRAEFEENINFDNSEFHLDVNFTDVRIEGIVNFNRSQFNSRIYIPWDSIMSHLAYDGSAYLSLVKSYNSLEKFDDADECYYQYRKLKRGRLHFRQKISDYIPFLALGYGVHPEYPLIIGLVIIIIFAFIYSFGGPAYSPQNATILSVAIFATQTRMESFTGLNYILSIIEGILGVFLMACFIVSLAKKTLR